MANSGKSNSDAVTWVIVALLLVGAVLMGFQEVRLGKLLSKGPAPALEVKAPDGSTRSLAALKGKVVLVDFWATWCTFCVAEFPYLIANVQKREPRVTMLAVSADETSTQAYEVGQFLNRMPGLSPYAVYGTPAISDAWKARAFPTLYLVDANGQIIAAHEGKIEEDELIELLDKALTNSGS